MRDHLLHNAAPAHLGLSVHDVSHQSMLESSILAKRLLLLVGWGHISTNTMQWLAEGAILDGAHDETLHKLSTAGTSGKHSGNVRRDVFRHLYKGMQLPPPLVVDVPKMQNQRLLLGNRIWW